MSGQPPRSTSGFPIHRTTLRWAVMASGRVSTEGGGALGIEQQSEWLLPEGVAVEEHERDGRQVVGEVVGDDGEGDSDPNGRREYEGRRDADAVENECADSARADTTPSSGCGGRGNVHSRAPSR